MVKYKKIIRNTSYVLFVAYVIVLVYFLFFSDRYGRTVISNDYRYNLHLFKEIRRFVRYRHELGANYVILNLCGNVLIFVPYGFALPIFNRKLRGFFTILICSLLFSLAIEVTQLILKVGVFDVDDLLLNTIGGILGFVCFYYSLKLFNKLYDLISNYYKSRL